MTRRSGFVVAAVVLGVAALGCAGSPQRLKLAAGPQGGTWYPLAGALKNVLERHVGGAWVQVVPGGGVANVMAIEIGRADLALANSVSTVDALNGERPFKARARNICNLATLYPQYFQVVTLAGSGIDSPAAFRGRALATQPRGNTGEAITLHLLRAYGLTYADLSRVSFGNYTDSVTLMQDGNAQIFTLGTSVPASSVMELASARAVELVGIPDDGLKRMQAINAGYTRTVIPAGTYTGQDRDVPTIGYATHLIGRCSLDSRVVTEILTGVLVSLDSLSAVTRAIRQASPASMSADIGVPMHPAATVWYRQHGVELVTAR
ncbi:MAG TPA: TAXI family TRAP transporter solute-binding subunit [Vicinamibacterales bacterium]|nr:TAXI family TRAP transporter solute-binding subunit [Vicinamibacterales bacterium]